MDKKKTFVEYLSFSRQNRIAIISLLLIAALLYIFPYVIPPKTNNQPLKNDTAWLAAAKRLTLKEKQKWDDKNENKGQSTSYYQYDRDENAPSYQKLKGKLFEFDPNTLSFAGWQKLGLRDKTIHTIQNYLSKGGHFRKPEDLRRIYGLFEDEYERLAPYIKIAADTNATKKSWVQSQKPKYTRQYQPININTADSLAFQSLPGIGPYYARSIIRFRERLGGFYSVGQVAETYRLPDSTFQKIKKYLLIDSVNLRKININTADLEELKAHPYIRWNKANAIFNYRQQHGTFSQLIDLKKIMILSDDWYKKTAPYLTIE
ncbi:MAG: helix-hairpin-helix domain-containing protein [Chitinophagaceae bacterium]|nr:helix-hairpin-helix domain-containing protein [Chitinophagaceae bacterium]